MLLQALAILHTITVIVFSIRILLRDNLSSSARLAWFMVMLFAPYVGVILYLLFGEISLGRTVHRRHDEIFAKLRTLAAGSLGSCARNLEGNVETEYQTAFRAASVDGFGTTLGNKAELLPDAAIARSRLIEDIDNATESVQCLYYIWLDDNTGRSVAQALVRATRRGVAVHAMADGLGSRKFVHSKHWRAMRVAGVKLSVALPVKWVVDTILFSRLDLRNHRKITVIDNCITWCGSQNCADPEFSVKAKYGPWVDIMLRLQGPVAAQSQLLFASDWLLNSGEEVPESFAMKAKEIEGGFPAQLFADGPTDRRGSTPQLFATLLALARKEVVISTPYFVPSSTVLDAICAAAFRAIDVTMIFPKRNDSWVVAAASHSYYRQLLEHGVRIFEFRDGLLHSKTFTIDRRLSLIGSTNLDLRSFDLNYENDILLRDGHMTQLIYDRQQEYIAQSDSVTLEDVNAWTYHRRIWNNVVATIGPIL
ncbi:MAG: cardiolipin synthase [Gammaproteobacteria bacterium]|uniref:cardiolipin synthase n=1 Tax=Pseudomaricurvus alcaniphilus TaxID=1166482 RepID=UPI00140E13F1|nr:cardiolipin synthase [Pseudomaricurvus alcaniphilus]MBR9911065.1 cardiolipin synthase [Gammaproteobacteria bacterium]NHN36431.1 cardiolipin synthase [Pseudomaricurvus alcaniphilus]